MTDTHTNKSKAFGIVFLSYIIAIAAAFFTGYLLQGENIFVQFFLADLVGTVIIFLFSIATNNSSFYDPYWSVGPIVIALALLFYFSPGALDTSVEWLILVLVSAYGLRLTFNWMRSWPGLHHQDWRYADLHQKTGPMYWWVSFSGIHLFPTALVFMGCLPLFAALTNGSETIGLMEIIAAIVTLTGILLEGIADNQLLAFRRSNPAKGEILNSGLWKYSRHPNYLGEMTFWWGLFLFGLAAKPDAWMWMISGALAITLLFVFYSVPALDERSVERRPEYAEHMKKVSGIIPWFPKK